MTKYSSSHQLPKRLDLGEASWLTIPIPKRQRKFSFVCSSEVEVDTSKFQKDWKAKRERMHVFDLSADVRGKDQKIRAGREKMSRIVTGSSKRKRSVFAESVIGQTADHDRSCTENVVKKASLMTQSSLDANGELYSNYFPDTCTASAGGEADPSLYVLINIVPNYKGLR